MLHHFYSGLFHSWSEQDLPDYSYEGLDRVEHLAVRTISDPFDFRCLNVMRKGQGLRGSAARRDLGSR